MECRECPYRKPGQELIAAIGRDRRATMSHEEAIGDSELLRKSCDTEHDRGPSLQYVRFAFRAIGQARRRKMARTRWCHRTVLQGACGTASADPGSTRAEGRGLISDYNSPEFTSSAPSSATFSIGIS